MAHICRFCEFHCLGETAIRKRLATARPSFSAGMNFQVKAAVSSSGSTHFTFPTGSADLTFPARSTTNSRSNSGCPCSCEIGGRCNRIASGGTTCKVVPCADVLVASKTWARFFLRAGRLVDTLSAWLRIPGFQLVRRSLEKCRHRPCASTCRQVSTATVHKVLRQH